MILIQGILNMCIEIEDHSSIHMDRGPLYTIIFKCTQAYSGFCSMRYWSFLPQLLERFVGYFQIIPCNSISWEDSFSH